MFIMLIQLEIVLLFLNRGRSLGTFSKKDISREELLGMMAGGEELDKLEVELKEIVRLAVDNIAIIFLFIF